MEKLVRIYDLERPDAAPQQLEGAAKGIRSVNWLQGDGLIITTQQDTPGLDVWDTKAGGIVKSLPTDAPVTSVDVSGGSGEGQWAGGFGGPGERAQHGRARSGPAARPPAAPPRTRPHAPSPLSPHAPPTPLSRS
jgi:hypothetical protein